MNYCLTEKQKLVEQAGFNMTRPLNGFEVIGGLDRLKTWSGRLRKRFTKSASEFGFIRKPSGLLLAVCQVVVSPQLQRHLLMNGE